MVSRFLRYLGRFLRRSRTINNEPLNKVSLVVIILVDIVILSNVFIGLNDIAQWPISPEAAYPCYAEWSDYRDNQADDKDFDLVRRVASRQVINVTSAYNRGAVDRLGEVSPVCLEYEQVRDGVRQPAADALLKTLNQKEGEITALELSNSTIRQQYDSTLLEEIAGQPREQSINQTGAAEAKATLAENDAKIETLEAEISELETKLVEIPESAAFLEFLAQEPTFQTVEQAYEKARFWYPTIQLIFQALFLVPLMVVTLAVYKLAQRRRYGLVALLSWHLLVIFSIPLILRVFEFFQAGVIFAVVFDVVSALFGQLLFLVSYIYILLIPLLGFGVIKLAQRFVFNPKLQAAGRVQKSRCIKCAKKIKLHDTHCPHCGYHQYRECGHCHQQTYKYLPYCSHCGTSQPVG
ncbi:MAG: hypothetical protein AAF821_07470 [Cyanobacteria bacterium P01_D01_bin.156]